jgi:hypothetical protein
MVLVLAASIEQAGVVFGYIKGILQASPALAREVLDIKRNEIELRNGIVIAVHSNSFRTVRGRTLVAAVLDEVSFWRDDTTANPDVETYRAILPSLATTNGMLVGISTPYRKIGLLHQKHRDHFAQDGDEVLVVQGSSQTFNSTLSDATISQQRAADPLSALSEWDAEFRSDISSFLDDRLIEQAVEIGRPLELPPLFGFAAPTYAAFTDPSGGVGSDSYTFSIGHREDDAHVVDLVRGIEGIFNPVEVTKQYAALCQEFHLSTVTGDHYAAQWVSSAWADCGISYVKSELPKSQIYLEVLPLFSRGLVRLPDHAKLLRELRLLERHTHRSGKDVVDHGPRRPRRPRQRGVRGAQATEQSTWLRPFVRLGDGSDDPVGAEAWRSMRLCSYLRANGIPA